MLDLYRAYVVLHERLVPYVRAAAATAARTGLPIVRPLCLTDPGDPRGWEIGDAYGYGPALWVAPVLDDAAREGRSPSRGATWIEAWSGDHVVGGTETVAPAPVETARSRRPCGAIPGSGRPAPAWRTRRGSAGGGVCGRSRPTGTSCSPSGRDGRRPPGGWHVTPRGGFLCCGAHHRRGLIGETAGPPRRGRRLPRSGSSGRAGRG
ncbi:MAG: hypothetical protein ACR2KV_01560 [Solirubrobacteraceae bacterium]